ncbi:MAG: formylglycine-generating enzyme family protein [Bacteroidota bacterium]|jgi:formylglycine-generating enzyme required for sulfatase activity
MHNNSTENHVLKRLEANMVDVEGGEFIMGIADKYILDNKDVDPPGLYIIEHAYKYLVVNPCYDQEEWAVLIPKEETPAKKVNVNNYRIGRYPVTQDEWLTVMGQNPSRFKDPKRPVENVSWLDVQLFLQKLNARTGGAYRLPTEAEWEYAARGGKKSRGYFLAGSNNGDVVMWYEDNSEEQTQPVGRKKPNELGLFDMNGNVNEWCHDHYTAENENSAIENAAPAKRAIRGGSFVDMVHDLLPVQSCGSEETHKDSYTGFRLAAPKTTK